MSGFLSGLARAGAVASGINQAAQNLAGVLNGSTPAPGSVTIGGVDLQDFEIPEKLSWGSLQEIVEKRLPGGAKVLQLMGAEFAPIEWHGMMIGNQAVARAQLLEQLVWAQQLTTLVFGDFSYRAIVKSFSAEYRNAFWQGDYTISCVILPDDPAPTDGTDDPTTGDPVTNSGSVLGNALGDVSDAIGDVATTAASIVSIGQAALNSVASIVTPITSALGINVPFLTTAQGYLSTAAGAVGALNGVAAGAAAVGAAADTLTDVASSVATGMQCSGAALALAVTNAPTGDLLRVADLTGAATAAGIQAVLPGAGYAANYSQDQIGGTSSPSPSANWTPVTPSLAFQGNAQDQALQQAALNAAANEP